MKRAIGIFFIAQPVLTYLTINMTYTTLYNLIQLQQ